MHNLYLRVLKKRIRNAGGWKASFVKPSDSRVPRQIFSKMVLATTHRLARMAGVVDALIVALQLSKSRRCHSATALCPNCSSIRALTINSIGSLLATPMQSSFYAAPTSTEGRACSVNPVQCVSKSQTVIPELLGSRHRTGIHDLFPSSSGLCLLHSSSPDSLASEITRMNFSSQCGQSVMTTPA